MAMGNPATPEIFPRPRRRPTVLLLDDDSAFEAHLRTEHFLDFDRTVKEWIEEKRVELVLTPKPLPEPPKPPTKPAPSEVVPQ